MRKCIAFTLVLFLLSCGALFYVHGTVSDAQDHVAVTVETLYGDAAAAEGLYVNMKTQSENHLYWDTGFYVAEEPEPEVDFQFTYSPRNNSIAGSTKYQGIYIEAGTQIYEGSGTGSPTMIQGRLGALGEAFSELVDSITDHDETRSATVDLSDYYEYYPVTVKFLSPFNSASSEAVEAFSEYFKIPVLEETKIELSAVERFSAFASRIEYTMSVLCGNVYSDCSSVMADSGCYFTFAMYDDKGRMPDMSEISGGFGLYYLPCEIREEGVEPLYDGLETVFLLDPETSYVVDLSITPDKKNLLLLTLEDGVYVLNVLNADTAEPGPRIELGSIDGVFESCYAYEGYAVYVFQDGTIKLVTEENGAFDLKLTADASFLAENVGIYYLSDGSNQIAWDGKRLAIISGFKLDNIYIMVFDESGLLYLGNPKHSQTGEFVSFEPLYEDSLTLSWGKE